MNRPAKVNNRLHKVLIIILLSAIFTMVSAVNPWAAEEDPGSKIDGEIDGIIDRFEEELPKGYEEYAEPHGAIESLGIKRIIEGVFGAMDENTPAIVSFLLALVGISLFSSLTSLFTSEMGVFASRAVGAVSCAFLFDRLLFLIKGGVESLNEIGDFFSLVVPVTVGVNSLGASPSTATAQALGMGVTLYWTRIK